MLASQWLSELCLFSAANQRSRDRTDRRWKMHNNKTLALPTRRAFQVAGKSRRVAVKNGALWSFSLARSRNDHDPKLSGIQTGCDCYFSPLEMRKGRRRRSSTCAFCVLVGSTMGNSSIIRRARD